MSYDPRREHSKKKGEQGWNPRRERSRSPGRDDERQARMARLRQENEKEDAKLHPKPQEEPENLSDLDEEEQMQRLLGFGSFGSTKNTKVDDNHKSSARGASAKHQGRKYRQYMNRKNGFNRPLDKMD